MLHLTQRVKDLRFGDRAIRRNPLVYSAACRHLDAVERADLDARRRRNRERLADVLSSARRIRYGREVRGSRDLSSWPILGQASVRADPSAFRGASRLFSIRASTGGTSGFPLPLARSLYSVAFEQACIDRMMALLDVDASRARIAVLRGDNVKDPSDFRPPYWKLVAGERRLLLSSNHLNASTAPLYADAIEEFAPDLLWAYPTAVESLCVHLARARRKLSLARVLTSSEVLRPEAWSYVSETLGCRLLDYYGQGERVAFAYATEPCRYRFLPGYSHVELLPAERDGGDMLYEIVGTSLWNRAMPLVRYRTGDLIRLPAGLQARELEEVALGARTFAGIIGREGDALVSPDGVRLTAMHHLQRDVPNLMRIQIVQESPAEVRILVLATARFGEADEQRLMSNVRTKLPASMRVRIERTNELERTSLGKTPFVSLRPAAKALMRELAPAHSPAA